MGSIIQEKNKTYTVRVYIDGRQIRFRGFTNRREAQRVNEHIEELNHSKKTGFRPPAYVEEWLKNLSGSPLYARLVKLELAPKIQEHTIADLIKSYRESLVDVVDSTWHNYRSAFHNVLQYFGANTIIENITIEDAASFGHWLRTEPLNSRTKKASPLSSGTANRRIVTTRQLFSHAIRMGWITRNPFSQVKAGISANPDKLAYIPAEEVLTMMAGESPYWRLILGLGRFCGLRGASEMYLMGWDDVHFKTDKEPGWLFVKAVKNKRHGRVGRRVPLPDIMEVLFTEYRKSVKPAKKVFPNMSKGTNLSIMTRNFLNRAGLPDYPNPWYNLRKSFCSDLLEQIKDISVYEYITDHSYKVAATHYQIVHKGRMLRSLENINCFDGLKNGLKNGLVPCQNLALKESLQSTTDLGKLNAEPVKKDTKRNKKASSTSDCRDAIWALLNSNRSGVEPCFHDVCEILVKQLAYFWAYLAKHRNSLDFLNKKDLEKIKSAIDGIYVLLTQHLD